MLVLMFIFRATVSAVSCLVVPAFICIDLFFSCALKLNDDDDDDEKCLKKWMETLFDNFQPHLYIAQEPSHAIGLEP